MLPAVINGFRRALVRSTTGAAAGLLLWCSTALAQHDSTFRVVLQADPGYAISSTENRFDPPNTVYASHGLAGALRLMWTPDHLLSVGLETGWYRVSQLDFPVPDSLPGPRQGQVVLNAVPVLLVFQMGKYGIEASAGLGYFYYMVNSSNAAGRTVSSDMELGWMMSAAYTWSLSERMGLGVGLKYYRITERYVGSLVPSVRFSYNLLQY